MSSNNLTLFPGRESYEQIYKRYFARMFRFAKVYVGADEDAEKIQQDVLSYLLTLVKYKSLDWLRHKSLVEEYKQDSLLRLMTLEKLPDTFPTEEELKKQIFSAINNLPEKCRQIFLKSRIEGKKYKEIANELNISVNTVENQMSIALKKLRTELKDYLPLLVLFFSC